MYSESLYLKTLASFFTIIWPRNVAHGGEDGIKWVGVRGQMVIKSHIKI